jgi:hypothetical protein
MTPPNMTPGNTPKKERKHRTDQVAEPRVSENRVTEPRVTEPRGFGEHSRGLSGEYAHEQGWGLAVEERTRESNTEASTPGSGSDYDYGARDFGDEPLNMAMPSTETVRASFKKEDRT